MKKHLAIVVTLLTAVGLSAQTAQPKYQQGANSGSSTVQKGTSNNPAKGSLSTAQKPGRYSYSPQFTGADQATIRTCMTGSYGNTGIRVRPLPTALDSQVQVNTKLSSALQGRVQPMPNLCSSRLLGTLPAGWSRVLLGNHVLLLDPSGNVSDMFDLN